MEPQDIFDAINKVRENPNAIINQIKDQLKRFESSTVYRSKNSIRIRTISGKAGWQDAIMAIQRQKPKSNLNWNSLLAVAAEEYKQVVAEDQNINPFQVIKSVCAYEGNISFNVNQSDTEQDIIQLVAAMIVGDGDQKKGVRTAIFHPLYKQFACSVRKSGNKNIVYTIFAQNVLPPTETKSSPKKQQIQKFQQETKQQRVERKSNWDDEPIKKQQALDEPKTTSSLSNKYKVNNQIFFTKEDYLKRGKQLIAQLNKIRKQPKQYVHVLKAQLQKFKDDKTINTDYGIITTKEGRAPYEDLMSELQSQYPLPTIKQVTGLSLVAIQQIIETDSLIESKVPVQELLDRFCAASQGIRSIKLKDIQGMPISAMLMRLLVGDGDRKRTARRKMLSPICKAIGCAISKDILVVNIGQTARDNQTAVQDYIENLNNNGNEVQRVKTKKQQQLSIKLPKNNQENIPYFGTKGNSNKNNAKLDEKVVVKKVSKSRIEKKGGRGYKITEIQILYDNGQIQTIVQQELLN